MLINFFNSPKEAIKKGASWVVGLATLVGAGVATFFGGKWLINLFKAKQEETKKEAAEKKRKVEELARSMTPEQVTAGGLAADQAVQEAVKTGNNGQLLRQANVTVALERRALTALPVSLLSPETQSAVGTRITRLTEHEAELAKTVEAFGKTLEKSVTDTIATLPEGTDLTTPPRRITIAGIDIDLNGSTIIFGGRRLIVRGGRVIPGTDRYTPLVPTPINGIRRVGGNLVVTSLGMDSTVSPARLARILRGYVANAENVTEEIPTDAGARNIKLEFSFATPR
jgi:hypothetical protein